MIHTSCGTISSGGRELFSVMLCTCAQILRCSRHHNW